MTGPSAPLQQLDDASDAAVKAAIHAVEVADEPVSGDLFRALNDPNLRAIVAARLKALGRELITITDDDGDVIGWTSGYSDDVATALLADGADPLSRTDRAVLGMVLLWTVAMPRARGHIQSRDWTDADPVTVEELCGHRANGGIPASQIRQSLRKLRELGVLARGRRADVRPGPQFHRLTARQSDHLWARLIIAADPTHPLARQLATDPTLLHTETP